ncbi:MAG: TAXI family TRAP transporter solute-binding subunit [Myxococcota bacterium]
MATKSRASARQRNLLENPWLRGALVFAAFAALAVVFAVVDLDPDVGQIEVRVLSGSPTGNYHAVVDRLALEAERRDGAIENLTSRGSIDNLQRLSEASDSCDVRFALAQDGLPWPEDGNLHLVARLPESETVLFLGREADSVRVVADLAGRRIGIGPEGSGTDQLARQLFASRGLGELDVTLLNLPIDQQMSQLRSGALDLGVFVMVADADLIDRAVREEGLTIASFEHARSIAGRLPIVRSEVMPAGYYDPFLVLPAERRNVLVVDTLLLGNGCASRTETMGMLSLLETAFPDLVDHNNRIANQTGLPENDAAKTYFTNGGPELLDFYIPWLADVIPLSNLIQLSLAISVLLNLMTFGHKFRLWRIDALRVGLENRLQALFDTAVSEEVRDHPTEGFATPQRTDLDHLIEDFDALRVTCRQQSLSWLVPMGQEMSYRHQETLIIERLTALNAFRDRLAG